MAERTSGRDESDKVKNEKVKNISIPFALRSMGRELVILINEMNMLKPDYGNWIPKKLLALLYSACLASAVLLCVAVNCEWWLPLAVILCRIFMRFFVLCLLYDGVLSCLLIQRWRNDG